jgi:hypothetical protein
MRQYRARVPNSTPCKPILEVPWNQVRVRALTSGRSNVVRRPVARAVAATMRSCASAPAFMCGVGQQGGMVRSHRPVGRDNR